ncbi:MAG: hypothetical protein LQ346_001453 [Caloplaca aetnensis]|nr:MAG: hypothetical protein LQ346_001453 [Caloplaca aetnensis]
MSQPYDRQDLIELAETLLSKGPHKIERTPRRVRVLFDKTWIVDTTYAHHVWEHAYYPQYYVDSSSIDPGSITNKEPVGDGNLASLAMLQGPAKSTGRILVFEQGQLAGLTRLEFAAMDAWYEEDTPIYVHPKDPYKRIDILPSSRNLTVKVHNVVVAESIMNLCLFETGLRPRYYMPKTAIKWQYTAPSETTTLCPYKGEAEYYHLIVDGKEIKDAIWWYRYPTQESIQIAGMACFYNEKVEVFVDGVEEEP